jgi:hypothetical protein
MIPTYHKDIYQNTQEWLDLRLGLLTASNMKKVITPKTLEPANNDTMRAFAYSIAAQRAACFAEPQYESWDMQRGHLEEPIAIEMYCTNYADVERCGFITNTFDGAKIGYSPDGLVGDDGLIEVKSRGQELQFGTFVKNAVPCDFLVQIQTGLLVSRRRWCDFISYSNGMPLFVKRVEANPDVHDKILKAATAFELEVQDCLEAYKQNTKGVPVAPLRVFETGDEITL